MIDVERLLTIARDNDGSPILYYLSKSLADGSRIDALVEKLKENPNQIGVLVCLDAILRSHYILEQ